MNNVIEIYIEFYDGFWHRKDHHNGTIFLKKDIAALHITTSTLYRFANTDKVVMNDENHWVSSTFSSFKRLLAQKYKRDKILDASGYSITFVLDNNKKIRRSFDCGFKGNKITTAARKLVTLFDLEIFKEIDVFDGIKKIEKKPIKPIDRELFPKDELEINNK